MSDTPELDRLAAINESGDNQVIGEFLEWAGANGYHLTKTVEMESEETSLFTSKTYTVKHDVEQPVGIEEILYHFFNIDPAKLESERRMLLDRYRAAGASKDAT